MKRFIFLLSVILSSFGLVAQAGNPDQIVGVWRSPTNSLMIKIDKVGNHFQGRIVWLRTHQPNKPALDENNPDEHLQNMPLKGNKVIKELSFNSSEEVWEGGTFYHHIDGKLYNCRIALHSNNQIKITRFIQSRQDGVSETWTRQ
ncbi:MAG: DUF2147 domain-containing protein [Cytophagales bacterium]|nr:DUF2147 domain-containing protein [Cytophagales bacterium]